MNIINGKSYPDGNISISNGKIKINGKPVDETLLESKIINIKIEMNTPGSISIDCTDTIQIYGNVDTLDTANGNVEVMGNAKTVKTVNGNIKFDTLIEGGSVKTVTGNIKYKKETT